MKTIKILVITMMVITALVYARVARAQAEEWQQLGVHVVDYTLDYDVIPVTYKKGTFTTLKIRVKNGSINLHRCMITFEDGEKQEVEVRHPFTDGSEKTIDLKGNNRIIEKVTFWYDTRNKSTEKAVVEVWGKK